MTPEHLRNRTNRLNMHDIGSLAIIIAVGLGSFALGRLSAKQSITTPISLSDAPTIESVAASTSPENTTPVQALAKGGTVVASKNGSRYYYPFCAAAERLNPETKITFPNEEAAKAAGYTPAQNCSGMK